MYKELKEAPKKTIKNVLKPWMQERYLLFLLEKNGISPNVSFSESAEGSFQTICKGLQAVYCPRKWHTVA